MNKELESIVNRISRYYKPERVILFGSAAKGRFRKGSDLDLLIIKKTATNPWDRILEVDQNIEHNIPIDIFVYTPDEIAERLKLNDFFIKEILEEGKILYEKQHPKDNSGMARKGRKYYQGNRRKKRLI